MSTTTGKTHAPDTLVHEPAAARAPVVLSTALLGIAEGAASISQDQARGRFITARRGLPAGTPVQACRLYAHGIAEAHKKRVCAHCLAVTDSGTYALACKKCQQVYVCSQRCLAALVASGHHIICHPLRKLATFKSLPNTKSLMRILLYALLARLREEDPSLEGKFLSVDSSNILRDARSLNMDGNQQHNQAEDNQREDNKEEAPASPGKQGSVAGVAKRDPELAFLDATPPADEKTSEDYIYQALVRNQVAAAYDTGNEHNSGHQSSQQSQPNVSRSPSKSPGGKSLQEMVQEKVRAAGGIVSRQGSSSSVISSSATNTDVTHKGTASPSKNEGPVSSKPLTEDPQSVVDAGETGISSDGGNKGDSSKENSQDDSNVDSGAVVGEGEGDIEGEGEISEPTLVEPTFGVVELLQSHITEWQFDETKDWRKARTFLLNLLHTSELITSQEFNESSMASIEGSGANAKKNFVMNLISQIESNGFGIWSGKGICIGRALFPAASFYNHSCDPNCDVDQDRNVMRIKLKRDVEQGEPLTISYIDNSQPLRIRRNKLLSEYYFLCCCEQCVREESGAPPPAHSHRGSNNNNNNNNNNSAVAGHSPSLSMASGGTALTTPSASANGTPSISPSTSSGNFNHGQGRTPGSAPGSTLTAGASLSRSTSTPSVAGAASSGPGGGHSAGSRSKQPFLAYMKPFNG